MPICPFCDHITSDTYQCKKCGTFFCKKCIDKHEFCPKCSGRDFKKAINVVEVHGTAARKMMEGDSNAQINDIINVFKRCFSKDPAERQKGFFGLGILIVIVGIILYIIYNH